MAVNPALLQLAQHIVWKQASAKQHEKQALGEMPPGAPAGGGAAPAGQPAPGGQPMGGGPAAMSPPPMDPSMMGGMGGMMPGMTPAMPQQGMGGGQGAGGKPKFDPLMLDYRMYNLQQQMSAIMAQLGVQLPPGALVMPPGTMGAPPAEQAVPGGPMDPNVQQQQAGGQAGGQQQSAIGAIEPMQGASPQLAQAGMKTAAQQFAESLVDIEPEKTASFIGRAIDIEAYQEYNSPRQGAEAVAALFRSKANQRETAGV